MIKWSELTAEDGMKIHNIVQRAQKLVRGNLMDIEMDVSACHLMCPLDLGKLLVIDDFNFVHDVCGISQHINRETGKLEHCFVPRCSR